LRRFLQGKLPDYMVPAAFVPLEALPLTANGKIDRRQLPDPTSDRPDLSAAYIPPQTEIEQKIAGVWQEVLGVETVGVFDNFFDLGGNSLLAMQVYDRLREELRADFALVDLFRYPTVSALAQFFRRDEPSRREEPTAPTPQTERLAAGKARLKQRLHQKKQAKTVQK
jgi:acyl carrier protein